MNESNFDMGELRVLCELHKSDIVFITETWLCEDMSLFEMW